MTGDICESEDGVSGSEGGERVGRGLGEGGERVKAATCWSVRDLHAQGRRKRGKHSQKYSIYIAK